MLIAIPLFDQVTALDAVGPYEVLQHLPGVEVRFVGERVGTIRTDGGMLGLSVDATFAEVASPDVVVVPGGPGTRPLATPDSAVAQWVAATHPSTRWTTSVCTGALILAAAGLLDGLTATTHWAAYDQLRRLGGEPTEQRVVTHPDRRIITAAGVSSGIDMALELAQRLTDPLTAQAMQLFIEYDPHPPFDSGARSKASDAVVARVREVLGAAPEGARRPGGAGETPP